MTTPTLTHEQAAILRAIDVDVFCQYLGSPIIGSDDLSWAIEDVEVLELSLAGKTALAKYDATYTTVETIELERLQKLERKIEALFGTAEAMLYDDAGNICVHLRHGDVWLAVGSCANRMWSIARRGDDGLYSSISDEEHSSCGEALRKAFELFEVPEEPMVRQAASTDGDTPGLGSIAHMPWLHDGDA